MNSQDLKKFKLPDTPGVYFFLRGKQILYIGKATSLKDRVKSYFARDILLSRSPLIAKMIEEAEKIEFIETDSVLEALILEASEIKKYQPVYNSKEKDDKSYNYITITEEDFSKVLVTRGVGTYGPFPHGGELKEALKIIRKIFPFRDSKCKFNGRPCFNAQIGLCPGPCAGWISKKDYRKIIYHLRLFFEAKKPRLIKSLEKEMKLFAKEQKFE
ncbi:MAG: excinuclease ABC subunit C, partial [Patescibacteria group bacterium]